MAPGGLRFAWSWVARYGLAKLGIWILPDVARMLTVFLAFWCALRNSSDCLGKPGKYHKKFGILRTIYNMVLVLLVIINHYYVLSYCYNWLLWFIILLLLFIIILVIIIINVVIVLLFLLSLFSYCYYLFLFLLSLLVSIFII